MNKKEESLKRQVALFIVRTPYAENKDWIDLYNEFVTNPEYVKDYKFGAITEGEYNNLSTAVIKMIQDAQKKRNKVISD